MCEVSACCYATVRAGGRLLQCRAISPSLLGHVFGHTVLVYGKGYSFIYITNLCRSTSIDQNMQRNTLVAKSCPAHWPLALVITFRGKWYAPKASTYISCSVMCAVMSCDLTASLSSVCSATLRQNPKTVSLSLSLGFLFVNCMLTHQSH